MRLFDGLNLYLSDRFGGVSEPPYESLNLAFHVGDDPERVARNRLLALKLAGMEGKRLFSLTQVHGVEVVEVDSSIEASQFQGDGLMSDDPHVALLVMVADCNPLALYDPKNRTFALLHAGREGVKRGILTHALERMSARYGSDPRDMQVYVGAGIRGCCYEVGASVAEEFLAIPRLAVGVQRREGRYYLALEVCLKQELAEAGIASERTRFDPRCTACEGRFFSYRREGVTGRMGLFASL